MNKIQLKQITSNARSLSISFREEVEKFLHNYNLKSKIKFSTVEREFAKFQRMSNTKKANLKHIFSAKYKDALGFSCELLEKQLMNFMQNCNLNLFAKSNVDNINNSHNDGSSDKSLNNSNSINEVNVENIDLNNSAADNNNQSNNNSYDINNLNNNNKFFELANKNAVNKLDNKGANILGDSNSEKQYYYIKKNSMFSYLENAIISPLYKIINMFMIDKQKLIGEDYFTVYKLVFYLHQILFALYNSPLVDAPQDFLTRLSRNKNTQEDYLHLSKYFYGDIKQKLSETSLDYLSQNLLKLKDLKYFQFEETVNIFRVTLALIKKNNTFNFIHLRKKFYRFNIIENSYLGCYDENSKDPIFVEFYEEIVSEAADYFLDSQEKKIYEIIEEYKSTLGETFGDQFSLVKVLSCTDLDCEVNLTAVVFNYLVNKFADKLTRANQHMNIPQNVFTFDERYKINENENSDNNNNQNLNENKDYKNFVEGKNLKMQNFYVLFFLRNLFFFNPEKFQEALTNLFTTQKSAEQADQAGADAKKGGESLPEKNSVLGKKPSKNSHQSTTEDLLSSAAENDDKDQEETRELDQVKIHYFFSIINKYFIFGNLLCEAGKLFELYNERTLLRSNFIYDLLITNIFLMQNICEGHNQTLQELMFDLRLMPLVEIIDSSAEVVQVQQQSVGGSGQVMQQIKKNKKILL